MAQLVNFSGKGRSDRDNEAVSRQDLLLSYARAVPINAISAVGLGPLAPTNATGAPSQRLATIRSTGQGTRAGLETIGVTGRRVMRARIRAGLSASPRSPVAGGRPGTGRRPEAAGCGHQ